MLLLFTEQPACRGLLLASEGENTPTPKRSQLGEEETLSLQRSTKSLQREAVFPRTGTRHFGVLQGDGCAVVPDIWAFHTVSLGAAWGCSTSQKTWSHTSAAPLDSTTKWWELGSWHPQGYSCNPHSAGQALPETLTELLVRTGTATIPTSLSAPPDRKAKLASRSPSSAALHRTQQSAAQWHFLFLLSPGMPHCRTTETQHPGRRALCFSWY